VHNTRSRVAAVATLLVLMLALPAVAGADGRIPVSSTDDTASPAANRIDAVTNIVLATNARLDRVIAAHPPDPGAPEIGPVGLGFIAALGAYSTLGQSVMDACEGLPGEGPGDSVITDADAFAADVSETGIANQLASIATVLGNADDRLGGILTPSPGPQDAPEATSLNALSVAIDEGGSTAAGWLGAGFDYPPNPCTAFDG
jgi:hypothetical protein